MCQTAHGLGSQRKNDPNLAVRVVNRPCGPTLHQRFRHHDLFIWIAIQTPPGMSDTAQVEQGVFVDLGIR